jgi:hypothetical protein
MIPVPQSVMDAVDSTHQPRWSATLTPAGGQPVTVGIVEGEVRSDAAQYPRHQATIRIPTDLTPAPAADHFLPFGTRLRIDWTLNDTTIVVFEGPVVESVLARPEGTWRVEAKDDSALLSRDLADVDEFTFIDGETVADYVTRQSVRTLGALPTDITGAALTETLDLDLKPNDSDPPLQPWRSIESAVEAAGAVAYYRPNQTPSGPPTLVVADVPDLGTPVDTLSSDTNITGYRIRHERGYNRVLIVYVNRQTDTHVVTGEWLDTRPSSPMNVNNMGRVTYAEVTYNAAISQARADANAARLARKFAGRVRHVEVEAITRPWLEVGDTITVQWRDGASEDHLVVSIDMPLSAESMRLQLRSNRYKSGTPV